MRLSVARNDFFESFHSNGNSIETWKINDWGLSNLQDYFDDPEINTIEKDDLEDFLTYMAVEYVPERKNGNTSPLSGSSITNTLTAIHAFFDWAEEEWKETGVINRPDLTLPSLMAYYREISPLSQEEIDLFIHQAKWESQNHSTYSTYHYEIIRYIIVLVFLYTGCRVSELCRLNVGDLQDCTRTITIHAFGNSERKTKFRRITLPEEVYKEIKSLLLNINNRRRTDPLCPDEDGKRLTRGAVRHMMIRLSQRAGISHCHPHVLRHTYTVDFIRHRRGTTGQLRYNLGHSSFKMVEKYVNLSREEVFASLVSFSPVTRLNLAGCLV